jgi:hypothetical protein
MDTRIIRTAQRVKSDSRQEKFRALEVMVRDRIVFSAFYPGTMVRHAYHDIAEFSSPKELGPKDCQNVVAVAVVYIDDDKTTRMPLLSQCQLDDFIVSALAEGKSVIDLRKLGDQKIRQLYTLAKQSIDVLS